jgi:RND family efflux transporter MFP subunit
MHRITLILCVPFFVLTACGKPSSNSESTTAPPYVLSQAVVQDGISRLGLSGTVRARVEASLAFQVSGRILARHVDAGQPVAPGQVLFELDPRDLDEAVRAAQAELAAAESALATADADLARARELNAKQFISAQTLERAELVRREARTRLEAAASQLAQARNARGYARLTAPAAGVLIDVAGEPGQVIGVGTPVAFLARAGEREVEVQFPEHVAPLASGWLLLADGAADVKLREAAGAVDSLARTRRARYTIPPDVAARLVLGSVVRMDFSVAGRDAAFTVPIGALDERGRGPQVWVVEEGKVQHVDVTVIALDGEYARIRAPLAAGTRVVAVGTHLLREGMAVRERTR